MTNRWMMIVPRSLREFEERVGVNGFGFVGLLLGRDKEIVDVIRSQGPLTILESVTKMRT